ncbi:MAG TPA: alpha/beta hydrolase [Methylomirabilota bacterium]|nr:alpha/beta hydrolase [Methylomirabilota bacterium]
MSATGKLDRPGGSLYFEVIDATAVGGRSAARLRFGGSGVPGPGFPWSLADLSPELGRIRVPTLLLAPGRSPFAPLAVMEEMHAGIAGSDLVLFPDARHGLPCSHGAACGRALRAFLDRRAP